MDTPYKIHDAGGDLVAKAADCIIAAAVIAGVGGPGWTVRFNGRQVWHEGKEAQPAAESYDFVAETAANRQLRQQAELYAKTIATNPSQHGIEIGNEDNRITARRRLTGGTATGTDAADAIAALLVVETLARAGK